MFSYQQAVHVGEAQRQDILRNVERERLLKKMREPRPGRWDRLLARSGDWLIAAGQRLKARRTISQPALAQLSMDQ